MVLLADLLLIGINIRNDSSKKKVRECTTYYDRARAGCCTWFRDNYIVTLFILFFASFFQTDIILSGLNLGYLT